MNGPSEANRRRVLKTIGAGIVGGTVITGSASAQGENYGNGNGVGAFLTEDAVFKDQPLWDSGVADKTGQSTVDVEVGALTSVDIPDPDAPDEGPFAFAPKAVEVSPDTDVTWKWLTGHHSVTSYEGPGWGGLFDDHGDEVGHTFTHRFTEVGNYLYFCIPHGTPFPLETPIGDLENLLGMRGAVIVSDE